MKSLGTMGSLSPFIPTGRGVGLVEKRVNVYSNLGLTDSADFVGDFNHFLSSMLNLDDDVDGHLNHGEDLTTDTLSLIDSLAFNMVRVRDLVSSLNIVDHVHITLEGHHPVTSDYDTTANETIAAGQPVYVSGNNTVNLANASSVNTANAIGLAVTSANATESVVVSTEGETTLSDWTTVIGSSTLTPGAIYYLDLVDGQMSTTAPDAVGQVVVRMGIAITTTKFDIEVNEVVIL